MLEEIARSLVRSHGLHRERVLRAVARNPASSLLALVYAAAADPSGVLQNPVFQLEILATGLASLSTDRDGYLGLLFLAGEPAAPPGLLLAVMQAEERCRTAIPYWFDPRHPPRPLALIVANREKLEPELLAPLLASQDELVLAALLRNPDVPGSLAERMLEEGPAGRLIAAREGRLPFEIFRRLLLHEDRDVRQAAFDNPALPAGLRSLFARTGAFGGLARPSVHRGRPRPRPRRRRRGREPGTWKGAGDVDGLRKRPSHPRPRSPSSFTSPCSWPCSCSWPWPSSMDGWTSKADNGFSAGDGHRGFIEMGAMLNSGHYSNFTKDCDPSVTSPFDHGSVQFGGLNKPRDVYDAPPPLDFTDLGKAPAAKLLPYVDALGEPPLEGEYCQNAGLTPLGEKLILEMMRRGMIIEIDHMPKRSYARALQMLVENDYPAAGTHGSNAHGKLYELGGISTLGLPRCGGDPAAISAYLRGRFDAVASAGGYRAQGFGFDLNGLAGAPGPRFGALSGCSTPQSDPVTYPFRSYAGDVSFTVPRLGNRTVEFNSEGFVHLGLLPELVEDVRRMGATDADIEPIFRSAEGYIRMWERAESRAAALRAAAP